MMMKQAFPPKVYQIKINQWCRNTELKAYMEVKTT